jgi:hypothetical protein
MFREKKWRRARSKQKKKEKKKEKKGNHQRRNIKEREREREEKKIGFATLTNTFAPLLLAKAYLLQLRVFNAHQTYV